jgi:translation elongation factor EF-Tu-like GTPase
MARIHKIADDFEAEIRIFTTAEGGRVSPPVNGVRWDFAYEDNQPEGTLYAIYPDFFGGNGDSMPTTEPLPIGVELNARMVVLSEEMRQNVHRKRIREGVRFYCHEGLKRVAVGKVTRITGLYNKRASNENAA